MADADEKVVERVTFANDLTDETKTRIKNEAATRIDNLLNQPEFSRNDLSQLAGVSSSSIKNRAAKIASAEAIVVAILNGERTSGGTRKPSVESVKSFVESLDPAKRAEFLKELGLA